MASLYYILYHIDWLNQYICFSDVYILKYEIIRKWVENVHFSSAPFSIQKVFVAYHLYMNVCKTKLALQQDKLRSPMVIIFIFSNVRGVIGKTVNLWNIISIYLISSAPSVPLYLSGLIYVHSSVPSSCHASIGNSYVPRE